MLLAVESFIGHFERAGGLLAQDGDMHVGDFAGLCGVNELQCVSSAYGLPGPRVANADGVGRGESAPS